MPKPFSIFPPNSNGFDAELLFRGAERFRTDPFLFGEFDEHPCHNGFNFEGFEQ